MKKKKYWRQVDFAVSVDHSVKMKKRLNVGQIPEPCKSDKKANTKIQVILIVVEVRRAVSKNLGIWERHSKETKNLGKRLEKQEIRWRIKITQTPAILKSTRILRSVFDQLKRLAVTQPSVKTHELELVWKNRKESNNNNNIEEEKWEGRRQFQKQIISSISDGTR